MLQRRSIRRPIALGAALVSVLALSACVRVTTIAADAPIALDLEPIVGGLASPLDVAVRPAFPQDVVVAEQEGRLRIVRDGVLLETPLLDISDATLTGGERGLLGVAPHPDPTDGRVFVYYTALDGRQLVASFATDPEDPDRLLRGSEIVLLDMEDEFGNHNGGGLAFGPDGHLYIGTGDGGGAGDPLGSGRDLGSLLGKILRIAVDVDVDAAAPYDIPTDNPFREVAGARPEIWHTGLRNPFRFRFDPETGDLWIGDVGQGAWEEVNLAPVGVGGLDFGWNLQEGSHCFAIDPCDDLGLTLPVAEYGHDQGCAIIGGAVHRSSSQPVLEGWYIFADNCSGRVFGLVAEEAGSAAAAGRVLEPVHLMDSGRDISSIASGPAGELFATDLGGSLLRIAVAPES